MSLHPAAGPAAAPCRIALLGVGTVGRVLLQRLQSPAVGASGAFELAFLASSKRCLLPAPGGTALDLARWPGLCVPHDGSGDLPHTLRPGDLVVDATASEDLAAWHPHWLRRGLGVVTANKLGLGGPLLRHHQIRRRVEQGAFYGDAATVGAGLPLLRSVRALCRGGDRLRGLAGVLSGTLAWLFDGFDGRTPFSARVREAVQRGYAEPDPRVDLSGEDVRRKLLILLRAAGLPHESDAVQVESLLTPGLRRAAGPAARDAALAGLDAGLARRARAAAAQGRVLRYVARFDGGGARIGLEALAPDDPLAAGGGNDNRVALWTCRYAERPLVIQGPGAGAGVTAAALLDDLWEGLQSRKASGLKPLPREIRG